MQKGVEIPGKSRNLLMISIRCFSFVKLLFNKDTEENLEKVVQLPLGIYTKQSQASATPTKHIIRHTYGQV